MSGKSTGATTRDEAIAAILEWDRRAESKAEIERRLAVDTIVKTIAHASLGPSDLARIEAALRDRGVAVSLAISNSVTGEKVIDFLRRVWSYDTSPYVAEKQAHGQSIGRRRCRDMEIQISAHWLPYFGDQTVGALTRSQLTEFGLALRRKGLAPKTINHIMGAGTVALGWAHASELIPSNPAASLRKFAGTPKKRGVLTIEEATALFRLQWEDDRAFVGNLVAATTGLRQGEIAAIRLQDIGERYLDVRHSWSNEDGLKSPKNGETRRVPLLPAVRDMLLELVDRNPWQSGPEAWAMWSTRQANRPVEPQHFYRELMKTLPRLRVSQEEYESTAVRERERRYWQERAIVFHSWRHFYAARMADRLEQRKVMQATGHRSSEVFEVYADHMSNEVMEEIASTTGAVFGSLVSAWSA